MEQIDDYFFLEHQKLWTARYEEASHSVYQRLDYSMTTTFHSPLSEVSSFVFYTVLASLIFSIVSLFYLALTSLASTSNFIFSIVFLGCICSSLYSRLFIIYQLNSIIIFVNFFYVIWCCVSILIFFLSVLQSLFMIFYVS